LNINYADLNFDNISMLDTKPIIINDANPIFPRIETND
jgi:hypothetical protein